MNADGSSKWAFASAAGASFGSPAISADGTVYAGSYDGHLYAISSAGTQKWTLATGVVANSAPAIGADGTIYVGSDDYRLYAINPGGAKKWAFTTMSDVHSSPAIGADGTVYIGSGDNNLYAVGVAPPPRAPAKIPATTRPVWPMFHHDRAHTGRSEFDTRANTGILRWTFAIGEMDEFDNIKPSPSIGADGTVYIGSGDHNLYAVNPGGTLKWKFAAAGVVGSPAIATDGTVYTVSGDAKLYAVKPDGTQKWVFVTGGGANGPIFSRADAPVIGADGTIFVSGRQNFYASTPTARRSGVSRPVILSIYRHRRSAAMELFTLAPDISTTPPPYPASPTAAAVSTH